MAELVRHIGYVWARVTIRKPFRCISCKARIKRGDWDTSEPELLWSIRVAVPFQYAASKNAIYTTRRFGHVALRRESRAIRD